MMYIFGLPKGSLSIATTPKCEEDTTPFPGLLHLPLIHTFMLNVKEVSSTILLSLWYNSHTK